MEMSGEYRIPAPQQRVWEALNDPEILKTCIPGCESLDKTSDTEMTAAVRMRVGPVSARFNGKVTLSDIDPPNGYRIAGEGQGGAAGFAKGGATVSLVQDGAETVLTYKADAQVGGKLAQIGSRLIDGTARKLADEFFAKFAETLGGGAKSADEEIPGSGPGDAVAVTPPPPPPVTPLPPAGPSSPATGPVRTNAPVAPTVMPAETRPDNGPMTAEQAAAHNVRAAAESSQRGYRHWMVIGIGVVVLLIVYMAVR